MRMFTILLLRLLAISISLRGSLANANITIIAPPTIAKSNLTCEEFCAIPRNRNDPTITTPPVPISKSKTVVEHRYNTVAEWKNSRRQYGAYANTNEEYLKRSSIIFGLTELANEHELSTNCSRHLKEIATAVLQRDVWAIKVLDSSGTKESGFLWGHNYWLGSRHGCEAVQDPVYITLSDQYQRAMKKGLINDVAPFQMEYRVIYVRHNSPWQVEIKFMSERIIHIGLCLPKSCSNSEVYNLTQKYMERDLFDEGNIYDIHPEVVHIKDLKLQDNFFTKRSIKIVGAFLFFTIVMIVIALCYEPYSVVDEKNNAGSDKSDILNAQDISKNKSNEHNTKSNHNINRSENIVYHFVKCFDLMDNWKSLFTIGSTRSGGVFPVINGLRSVSCLWILIFHVIWYMYFTVDNKIFLLSYGERLFFQYVSTAPLLVDVFFTISGFLLAYNFIKNEKNIKIIQENNLKANMKMFGKLLLHRYLRLAPLYLVLTGLVEISTAYMEDVSIFHIHERYDQTCSKYWWRNIFFIQNFFHQDELCLNWTWSLACEMQFFIVSTLLLFLYAKNPGRAKKIFVASLITSIFWSYIVCFRSHYRISFDVIYNTGTEIYINPFIRIMPYLMGVGTGWFLVTNNGKLQTSPTTDKCLWNMAIVIFFACIFSTAKRDIPQFWSITLIVLGRASFSAAVSWMIVGSATGRGVWWSKFLEWNVFQHLNKLSYAIYLLNPFVIAMVFSLVNSSTHADPLLLCVLTSGFVVIVYISSIVFSLSFEIPYCKLSSYMLKRNSAKT